MDIMKRKISLLVCFLLFCFTILPAQPRGDEHKNERQPHRPNPERFIQDKVRFIVREMKLSTADSLRFVPIYKQLQKEKFLLMKHYTAGIHDLHRQLSKSPDAYISDSLYLEAVQHEYQYNIEDAKLELTYLEKFKTILSPRQLYDYSRAEKRFKHKFMNQDARNKKSNAARRPK